jgi:ring-1,2-phenylacetyl-CoA epoxidase subunit PaaC
LVRCFTKYCLRIGDDRLILGHRLSEWCGHAPILEEDIAMSNIALDLIGQASQALKYAGEAEQLGRTEDTLAYHRDSMQYRNLMLTEQPNGDFAFTMARQFLFDAYSYLFLDQLKGSGDEFLAAFAQKAHKEVRYHIRHSSEWMLRLGDGTEESHKRLSDAMDGIWMYTGEMFAMDRVDTMLLEAGIGVNLEAIRPEWDRIVMEVITKATLTVPDSGIYMAKGSRQGYHTENLGRLLAEMQIIPRSFPEATW